MVVVVDRGWSTTAARRARDVTTGWQRSISHSSSSTVVGLALCCVGHTGGFSDSTVHTQQIPSATYRTL